MEAVCIVADGEPPLARERTRCGVHAPAGVVDEFLQKTLSLFAFGSVARGEGPRRATGRWRDIRAGERKLRFFGHEVGRTDDHEFFFGSRDRHVDDRPPLRPGPVPVPVLHGEKIHGVVFLSLRLVDRQAGLFP